MSNHDVIYVELQARGYDPLEIMEINNIDSFEAVRQDKNGVFRLKGRFLKGTSGNVNNKANQPTKMVKKQQDDFTELRKEVPKDERKDAIKALEDLLATSEDRYETYKIAKDLAPYQKAKLQSIEMLNNHTKRIILVADPSVNWGNLSERLTGHSAKELEVTVTDEDDGRTE